MKIKLWNGKKYSFLELYLKFPGWLAWRVRTLRRFFFQFPGILSVGNYVVWFKLRGKGVPFRHAPSLHNLVKLKSFLSDVNVDVVLINGTLLGAWRQGAFAGRPKDIDLIVNSHSFSKIKGCISQISNELGCPVLLHEDGARIHVFPKHGVEITILSPYFVNGLYDSMLVEPVPKICGNLSEEDLEGGGWVLLYGYSFMVPRDPEGFLVRMYGETWLTPDSKQYAWYES